MGDEQQIINPAKNEISIGSYGSAGKVLYTGQQGQEGSLVRWGENVFTLKRGDWGLELSSPTGYVTPHNAWDYNSGGYSGTANPDSTTNINSIWGNVTSTGEKAYISTSTAKAVPASQLQGLGAGIYGTPEASLIVTQGKAPQNAGALFAAASSPNFTIAFGEPANRFKAPSGFDFDKWAGISPTPKGFESQSPYGFYGRQIRKTDDAGNLITAGVLFEKSGYKPNKDFNIFSTVIDDNTLFGTTWSQLSMKKTVKQPIERVKSPYTMYFYDKRANELISPEDFKLSMKNNPNWKNDMNKYQITFIETGTPLIEPITKGYQAYFGKWEDVTFKAATFFENLPRKNKDYTFYYDRKNSVLLSSEDYKLTTNKEKYQNITITDKRVLEKSVAYPLAAWAGGLSGAARELGQNPKELIGIGALGAANRVFSEMFYGFTASGVRTASNIYETSMFSGLSKGFTGAQYVLGGSFAIDTFGKASSEAATSEFPISSFSKSMGGSVTQAAAFGFGDLGAKGKGYALQAESYAYYRENVLGISKSYVPLANYAEWGVRKYAENPLSPEATRFSTIPLRDLAANKARFEAASFFRNVKSYSKSEIPVGNALDKVGTLEVPKNPAIELTTLDKSINVKYYAVTHATRTGMEFPSDTSIARGESQQAGLYVSSRQNTQLYFLLGKDYSFKLGTAQGGIPTIIETTNIGKYSEELIPIFKKEGRYNTRLSDVKLLELGKTAKGARTVYLETRTFYGDTPEVQGVLAQGARFKQLNLRGYAAQSFGYTKYTRLPSGEIVPIRNFSVLKGKSGLSMEEFGGVVKESESFGSYKRTFSTMESLSSSTYSRLFNPSVFGSSSSKSKDNYSYAVSLGRSGAGYSGYSGKSGLSYFGSYLSSGKSASSLSNAYGSYSGSSGISNTSASYGSFSSASSTGRSYGSSIFNGFGSTTLPPSFSNQFFKETTTSGKKKKGYKKTYSIIQQFGAANAGIALGFGSSVTTPRTTSKSIEEFKYSRRYGSDWFKSTEERRNPRKAAGFGFRL